MRLNLLYLSSALIFPYLKKVIWIELFLKIQNLFNTTNAPNPNVGPPKILQHITVNHNYFWTFLYLTHIHNLNGPSRDSRNAVISFICLSQSQFYFTFAPHVDCQEAQLWQL